MAENSKISWCDHTHNEWEGCIKVSPGCEHCYAETRNKRFYQGVHWGPGPRRLTSEHNRNRPYAWNRRAEKEGIRYRVFCASLGDVFEDHPDVNRWRIGLISKWLDTPALDWLVLTKRIERVEWCIPQIWFESGRWPENVWMGFSAENQEYFDRRWSFASRLPAPVIFVSIEPQLGPIILPQDFLKLKQKAWVIIGGESGPGARPFELDWAFSLVDQCQIAGVPVFVKQIGDNPGWSGEKYELVSGWLHPKGGEISQWPEKLRVQQFPR